MRHELWRRAEELFHAALERPAEDRQAFLEESCGQDAELRRCVEMLVSTDERAGGFLEEPILAEQAAAGPGARGSLAGRQLGQYRILSLLGAGGMGEVYRAHDGKLGRDVAIKTLPPEFARDAERLARFRREARTLAALNHPNIATIHGLEESAELDYLVLELVEGETLRGPLPLGTALDRARQAAEALEAAHAHGIVHRDLKPANIKVTPEGRVKVLDFGLAKALRGGGADLSQAGAAAGEGTAPWRIVGTPGYMSPEQARGQEVDERTDVWAFGCLLFELLAGKRAFAGETASDAVAAVLEHEPDWRALPASTPAGVRELLRQCLRKDVGQRLSRIAGAREAIEEAERGRGRRSLTGMLRRPRYAIPAAALLLLAAFAATLLFRHYGRVTWVREQAIPEIRRLLEVSEYKSAFRLLRRARAILPNDPALRETHQGVAFPVVFRTNPPGAEVWATGYEPGDGDWIRLGVTPFTSRDLLWGIYRFRVVKPGFQPILGAGEARGGNIVEFDLDPEGALPPEMVRVPGGRVSVSRAGTANVGSFLIDRYEVTNRQYKQFIDGGGYRNREFWKREFVQDGRKLSWEEAMGRFRDSTGRPGPSTWELGEYPAGRDDHPVNGVSWFEAAAYAAFAGKQLPTVYHWQQAARPGFFAAVTELSNFNGAGPARVGVHQGIGAFGTLDLAGNVKEWCANLAGSQRCIRGGAWNEPVFMFSDPDIRAPWNRSAQNGIRCVRYDAREEAALEAPVPGSADWKAGEAPAPDSAFRLYESFYAYDPKDLQARSEGIDQENDHWKREKVSFAGPQGEERIPAYFYIPKRRGPPYRTILYAAAGMSTRLPTLESEEELFFSFLVRSGRAVLIPVLKGHYQRQYPVPAAGPNEQRDRLIAESKEFRRSIDYLASRPDVDRDRLAVYGVSRGACYLPVFAVGEQRLKAAVLLSVGLPLGGDLPESEPRNFLPRFRVPTLMFGGRFDYLLPVETSQRPMFRLLGAPPADKRYIPWDGGHGDLRSNFPTVMKETLGWFDRYLGPLE